MTPDASPPDERDEIGVPEAACILGVSPSHVARLVEEGLLAHHGTGPDSRIRKSDLVAYQEAQARRHALLDELAAESQEMGLY